METFDSPFEAVTIMEKLGRKLPTFAFDNEKEIFFINKRFRTN